MKVLDWIIDVVLSMILFERPELHTVVAIEISNNTGVEAFTDEVDAFYIQ
ncbi:MAG: hypothetical protein ACRC3Y_07900 [Romboutsia sp.]